MTVERETPQAVEQLYACGFGSYGTRGCGTKHHAQASLLKVVRLSDKRYYDEALGQGIPVKTGQSLSAGTAHVVAAQVPIADQVDWYFWVRHHLETVFLLLPFAQGEELSERGSGSGGERVGAARSRQAAQRHRHAHRLGHARQAAPAAPARVGRLVLERRSAFGADGRGAGPCYGGLRRRQHGVLRQGLGPVGMGGLARGRGACLGGSLEHCEAHSLSFGMPSTAEPSTSD